MTFHPRVKESLISLVAVVGACLLVYFGVGLLAQWMARSIPDDWETKYLSRIGDSMIPRDSSPDGELKTFFQALVKAQNDPRKLKFKLYISEETDPNAFALPGGSVVVTQGLLDLLKTKPGLAFVLGHELGHHQHRHVLKHMGRSLIIGGLASIFLGDPGFIGGLLIALIQNSYSQDQEYEADLFGYELTRKIYGPSQDIVEFFDGLEKEKGRGIDLKLLSTHPYTPARREKILKLLAK